MKTSLDMLRRFFTANERRSSSRTPWLLLPWLIAGFWLTDALVGWKFMPSHNFFAELLSLHPHEVFMRLAVAVLLSLSAHLWSVSISQQNRRIDALEDAESRLRSVAAALAAGDAENRRALGRRLHENVGQSLAAAQMYLAGMDAESRTPGDARLLRSASLVVGGAVAECRDIAQDLSPSGLETYGLSAALETLRERMMNRTGVSIELVSDAPSCDLERDAMLAAFQALSDTIEMAACDPGTSVVRVESVRDDSSVNFVVTWDAPSAEQTLGSYEWLRIEGGSVSRIASTSASALRLSVPIADAA